jgi:hypothetical protein
VWRSLELVVDMMRGLALTIPLWLSSSCFDVVHVAGVVDSASSDAGDRSDAGNDSGPPFCESGATRCVAGEREVCVNRDGVREWTPVACIDRRICIEGACRVIDHHSSELATDVVFATSWAHPDIGIPPDELVAVRPDRFELGVVLGNVFEVESRISTAGASMSLAIPGNETVSFERPFDALSFAPGAGEPSGVPSSIFDLDSTRAAAVLGVPLLAWVFSPSWPTDDLDPRCRVLDPPSDCATRSFEGTIASSPPAPEHTVVSMPAEVFYDTCEERVVTEGLPFFGVASRARVRFRVTPAADLVASVDPEPVTASDPPGAIAARATEWVTLDGGGVYQATVRPPATRAECDPEPGAGCIRPCRTRPDLAGTRIVAEGNVQVFAGHTCGRLVPEDPCSYFVEEMMANSEGGSTFLVPGPASFEDLVRVRIVSNVIDGDLTIDGERVHLSFDEPLDLEVTSAFEVDSTVWIRIARMSRRAGPRGGSAFTMLDGTAQWKTAHAVPSMEDARVMILAWSADEVRLGGVLLTPTASLARHDIYETSVVAGRELTRIDSLSRTAVLFAVLPRASRTFAITRGASIEWSPE